MPRAKKEKPVKPQIKVTAVVFTPAEQAILQRMSKDASDVIGRRVSSSAVLRAVVRWLGKQGIPFAREQIIPLAEQELSMLRWGRTKKS